MYADGIWDLKINVSETKYLKNQQNIEGIAVLECENMKMF